MKRIDTIYNMQVGKLYNIESSKDYHEGVIVTDFKLKFEDCEVSVKIPNRKGSFFVSQRSFNDFDVYELNKNDDPEYFL